MTTHEINIYGDIVPFKWWDDGMEYDIASLNKALSEINPESGDELLVNIHTFGGCTTTAFAIYNKLLNFKTKNSLNITTRVDGYCASSGVILLLSGDKRIGNAYAEPFIHNAWTWTMGDKNEHKKQFEMLERVDNQIASLYAERTNISKEEALALMQAENFVKPEDALSYGFYTELENVYAAENNLIFNALRNSNSIKRKNNSNNMNKDKKSLWNKLRNDIDAFFGNPGAKNKIVFTSTNDELDFYELSDDDTPKVGDKATFNGKPAGESNNGEYTLTSGETYKFTGEELTEIVPANNNSELENEIANLKNEVSNLKSRNKEYEKQVTELKNKVADAEKILKNLKDLEGGEGEEEPEQPRNPKDAGQPEPVRNLFKNIK